MTDSAWTMRRSHPADTKSSASTSGVRIMRWASNGSVVCSLAARTTSGPNVRLGTNWPSMMSHWIRSQPAASSADTSSPSRAMSAGRTDGAIWMAGVHSDGAGTSRDEVTEADGSRPRPPDLGDPGPGGDPA